MKVEKWIFYLDYKIMRHVEQALNAYINHYGVTPFIEISNIKDEKNISPVLHFTIQSDPIGEVGVNGLQATDILKYLKELFSSLNEAFPCNENLETISLLNLAINWQDLRTANRISRNVEGKNEL